MDGEEDLFKVVTTTTGALSIRNNTVGEIMHNPIGPWREANLLYIDQSNLKAKLEDGSPEPLVIFDVGLGAAANAVSVLHWAEKFRRPVELISFEVDLRLAHFALKNSESFPHLQQHQEALSQVLETNHWQKNHIRWQLFPGDFLQTISMTESKADLVFYDPYSPKKNSEMWTTDCFQKLKEKCKPRAQFFNYSQATPIRAALLEAGFFVGYGMSLGEKETTTVAACDLRDLKNPLDERWFQRWQNSSTPMPYHCKLPEETDQRLRRHPQFCGLPNIELNVSPKLACK